MHALTKSDRVPHAPRGHRTAPGAFAGGFSFGRLFAGSDTGYGDAMTMASPPRGLRIALFALACATVIWICLIPADEVPNTGLSDKIEHAVAYAGLAVLGIWAFPRRYGRLAVGLMALGIIIEVLQGLMNLGRQADVMDAVADGAGLGLVLIAARMVGMRRARAHRGRIE